MAFKSLATYQAGRQHGGSGGKPLPDLTGGAGLGLSRKKKKSRQKKSNIATDRSPETSWSACDLGVVEWHRADQRHNGQVAGP